MDPLLSFDNRTFAAFAVSSVLLILKMFYVVFLLGKARVKHKVLSSPEDYDDIAALKKDKQAYLRIHPDVERAIRIQQNDIENIPAFIFLALLYVLTKPVQHVAFIAFGVFVAARILHTTLYWLAAPHRVRGMFFIIGTLVNLFLAGNVLWIGVQAFIK